MPRRHVQFLLSPESQLGSVHGGHLGLAGMCDVYVLSFLGGILLILTFLSTVTLRFNQLLSSLLKQQFLTLFADLLPHEHPRLGLLLLHGRFDFR